jgi:para-aminobenzoate synthetase/4-amino-4-deoxychorismate lyase
MSDDARIHGGSAPFVLIDDASGARGAVSRLYKKPRAVITARAIEEVRPALAAMRAAVKGGAHLAGWIGYEAGLAFEEKFAAIAARRCTGQPLLWFGVFDDVEIITADRVEARLPPAESAWLSAFTPRIRQFAYTFAFAFARDLIFAGDIYQVNLSLRADAQFAGSPPGLYRRLRAAGAGAWSALVHDGSQWLLSTSPEKFFSLTGDDVEARPMKGTAKRHADPEADRSAARMLQLDPKERAENIMIVDLLRNDLSRIAATGSVSVPSLLDVETYPTVHAMTSTITAKLRAGLDAFDVLTALFPCGSVTGAPKIRAMEVIDELEDDNRGAYTGSIGWFAPNGDCAFNVAIRTLIKEANEGRMTLGLGSGLVSDSRASMEWAEIQAKGAFANVNRPTAELIETMRGENGRILSLDDHLARLAASAQALGFEFDENAIRGGLARAALGIGETAQVRLLLHETGAFDVELKPVPPLAAEPIAVKRVPLPVARDDFRLRYKTTLRGFYDETRRQSGAYEVVFFDADGFLTEGSFTNVFVPDGDRLLTPPLSRGLLPGILRQRLLREGKAVEADVKAEDIKGEFYIGNALRGLIRARLA